MSGRFLLDTNIVIALFADEAIIKYHLAQAREVFISSVVIGELYYGARKSRQVEANLARVDALVANTTVLICDTETARRYGEVKHKLRLKGRPLPENGIWIAALVLQHDLVLVTRDVHFQEVQGLQVVAW